MSSSKKGPNGPDETDATWIEPQRHEALRSRARTIIGAGNPDDATVLSPTPVRGPKSTIIGVPPALAATPGRTVIDELPGPISAEAITPDFLRSSKDLVLCFSVKLGCYLVIVDMPSSARYLRFLEKIPSSNLQGIGVYIDGQKHVLPAVFATEDRLNADHVRLSVTTWLTKQVVPTVDQHTPRRVAETLLDPDRGRSDGKTVLEPKSSVVAPTLPTIDNLNNHPDILLYRDHGHFCLGLLDTRAYAYLQMVSYHDGRAGLSVDVRGSKHFLPVFQFAASDFNLLPIALVREWLDSVETRTVIVADDATVLSPAPVPARVQADEVPLYSTAWDPVGPDGTYVNAALLPNVLPPPVYTPAVPQPDVDGTQVGGRSGHFASVPYAAPTVDTVQDDARFAEAEAKRNQRIIIGGVFAFLFVAGALVTVKSCEANGARAVETTPPATSVTPR